MDTIFSRHFTLEEANGYIPLVQTLFAMWQTIHDALGKPHGAAIKIVKQSGGNFSNGTNGAHTNGHKPSKNDLSSIVKEPIGREEEILVEQTIHTELAKNGIVLQDVRRGLIDFPCIREGREVFLCWELSDGDEIQWFHDLDGGYAGRQPL